MIFPLMAMQKDMCGRLEGPGKSGGLHVHRRFLFQATYTRILTGLWPSASNKNLPRWRCGGIDTSDPFQYEKGHVQYCTAEDTVTLADLKLIAFA